MPFENGSGAGAGSGNAFGGSVSFDPGPVPLVLAHSKNTSGDTVVVVGGKCTIGALQLMAAYDSGVFIAAIDSTAKVYAVSPSTASARSRPVTGTATSTAEEPVVGPGVERALYKRTLVYVSDGHNRPAASASSTDYGFGVTHTF